MPRRSPAAGPATAAAPPDAGGLAAYRAKRDFARTPEPPGAPAGRPGKGRGCRAEGPAYVVQKHAARRLHFDLRLELGGTLKSWAVPQGPSLDPRERRLAVHVEDHPLAYGGFEGAIPQGQYGGGTVMPWDRGSWEPAGGGDPAAAYAAGKLKLRLHGERLRGGWTLVRLGGGRCGGRSKPDAKDLWLLIKERDGYAREGGAGGGAGSGGCDEDRSVLSGRTMAEIAAAPERVWRSDRAAAGPPPAKARQEAAATAAASSTPPPAFVPPQLATPAERVPEGPGWLSVRAQARRLPGAAAGPRRRSHRPHPQRPRLDWALPRRRRPRQEFVIGGHAPLKGHTFGLGALLLGVRDEGGGLRYVGRVGTGWDARAAEDLVRRLEGLRAEASRFARLPRGVGRGVRWVRPELVAEVGFQSWTADGLLRHASFHGLREDKDPGSVVREDPRPAAPALARCSGTAGAPVTSGVPKLHGVPISSAERVVLDRPRLTKGDLARYHAEIADLLLPRVDS